MTDLLTPLTTAISELVHAAAELSDGVIPEAELHNVDVILAGLMASEDRPLAMKRAVTLAGTILRAIGPRGRFPQINPQADAMAKAAIDVSHHLIHEGVV